MALPDPNSTTNDANHRSNNNNNSPIDSTGTITKPSIDPNSKPSDTNTNNNNNNNNPSLDPNNPTTNNDPSNNPSNSKPISGSEAPGSPPTPTSNTPAQAPAPTKLPTPDSPAPSPNSAPPLNAAASTNSTTPTTPPATTTTNSTNPAATIPIIPTTTTPTNLKPDTTPTNPKPDTTPTNPKAEPNQSSGLTKVPPNNPGGVTTLTATISAPNGPPTPHRNVPPPTSSPAPDNSSGLSGGAITAIAVVAGIIGFVLLFWVGVQILQSKRRRREEAEMQEIDFDPTGNGSVNGDIPFPRASAGGLERGPTSLSGSNSLNYQKSGLNAGHYPGAGVGYGEDLAVASESEFVDGAHQLDYDPELQRQATLGASSAYSGRSAQPYYPNNSSRPPAPYPNYAPYPAQYTGPPSQIRYEPPGTMSYDYNTGHYAGSNPAPHNEYHH